MYICCLYFDMATIKTSGFRIACFLMGLKVYGSFHQVGGKL